MYLSVDSKGKIINLLIRKTRHPTAAKRFFKKALRSFHASNPRVITLDKNPAYFIVIEQLNTEKSIPNGMRLR